MREWQEDNSGSFQSARLKDAKKKHGNLAPLSNESAWVSNGQPQTDNLMLLSYLCLGFWRGWAKMSKKSSLVNFD